MSRIGHTTGQAFKQIWRNRAMTLASVFAITAMLLILGLFFIAIININSATAAIKQDYNSIEVFLADNTKETNKLTIKKQAESWDNVDTVTYRSKEDALKILKERWGDRAYLLDSLNENPLPDSFVITVKNLDNADQVVENAKGLSGIDDVKYYKDTVDKLLKVTNYIQVAALIVMIFLIIVSIVVVSNTIKLTVFNRSEEISIMKYVGATNWFIRGPFLAEGIIIGGISALISSGIIAFIYTRLVVAVGDQIMAMLSIPMVSSEFLIYNLVLIFLALGISIGAWGSIVSMRRFLDT